MIVNCPWLLVCITLILSFVSSHQVPLALGEDSVNEEIEMLEIIEVPGTAVIREPRTLEFSHPDIRDRQWLSSDSRLHIPVNMTIDRPAPPPPIIQDPVGQAQGIWHSVKPLTTQRPPYPRFAREQGWQGTTILRITVDSNGTVVSITTQRSSGFPMLDDSASRAVKKWEFAPAKNGEFTVASTVDVPIRFDLDQPQ